MEECGGIFGNIDEKGLPNESTLLDRESVILVRIDDKSDGTILVWEGGLLGRPVKWYRWHAEY